jgi:hypothetical protein
MFVYAFLQCARPDKNKSHKSIRSYIYTHTKLTFYTTLQPNCSLIINLGEKLYKLSNKANEPLVVYRGNFFCILAFGCRFAPLEACKKVFRCSSDGRETYSSVKEAHFISSKKERSSFCTIAKLKCTVLDRLIYLNIP